MNNSLITKQMLQDKVKNKPYIMVVSYADWCGHCKRMKDTLGSKFRNYPDLIFLSDNELASDLKDFYPHVRIFKYGKESTGSVNDLYELVKNR